MSTGLIKTFSLIFIGYGGLGSYSPAVIDQKNIELFNLMIKAWNLAILLMTLTLTFCDIGPFQINFWRRELHMSVISQHGNEAENKNPI